MGKTTVFFLCMTMALFPRHITIAGTADLQGMLEPSVQKVDLNGDGKRETVEMGGIARLATLYKKLKTENPDTLIVSAGDDLMNRYFHVFKGKAILMMMSEAGYDVLAPGNHEFDKGTKTFADALEGTHFTTLCSDLDVSGSVLKGKCEPYIMKEMAGVKVGVFSLMVESLPDASSAQNISLKGSNVETAKRMVSLLKEKGADVIVLVSHIGYKSDVALAKQVKGIDVIFGGHSHAYVKKPGHIGKTVIVNGGEQGSQVVKVDIPLDKEGKVLHKKITMSKIPVTSDYAADDRVVKKLAVFQSKLPASIVLGETKKAWVVDSKVTRKSESPVADMVNDLMRKKYDVDIVLNNAGAFRGKKRYPAGEITNTMLKEIDEFGNYAYLLTIEGKYLKPILEHSAAQYGKGGFMQVSGLKYTVVLPNTMQRTDGEKVVRKGERVTEIKVLENGKWVDVDPKRHYTIVSNSFIAQKGGDGYFWFPKYGTDFQNTYATFYSIMAEEVGEKKELTPKERDGRIKVIR